MEINIVKAVQGLSCKFLDVVLWCITKLGEETCFVLALLGLYLLYSQKFAVKYGVIYLLSAGINGVIKNIIKRPRPHVASELIQNKLPASGYSFPSGHSQGYFVQATMGFDEMARTSKTKKSKYISLFVLLFVGLCVMFSRLYFGQHYLTDTLVGATCGIVVYIVFESILKCLPQSFKEKFTIDKWYWFLLIVSSVVAIVFFILELTKDISKAKVYKITAVFIAMSIGYFINKKYIRYEEKSTPLQTFLKGIILYGVLGLFLVAYNLWIKPSGIIVFVLYLIISLVCTILLPIIFKNIFKTTNNEKV